MSGPLPNPAARRQNKTGAFIDLPAEGRQGPPPPLPDPSPWLAGEGGWPAATVTAWVAMWATPQATMWDQSGESLHEWATMHAKLAIGGPTSAGLAELRQIRASHGLSPKALTALRWRIPERTGMELAVVKPLTAKRPIEIDPRIEEARRAKRYVDPRVPATAERRTKNQGA